MEFKETMKKTRAKKLESPMESATSYQVQTNLGTGKLVAKTNRILADQDMHASSKLANLRESAWKKLNQKNEDRSVGKGFNSLNHYSLVHKFTPMLQAMKIPDANGAVDKEWGMFENLPAQKGKTVHFASLMDICHLQNSE